MKEGYYLVQSGKEANAIKLERLSSEANEKGNFGTMSVSASTTNTQDFIKACINNINKLEKLTSKRDRRFFFVYRSVAGGGISRNLPNFAAKPLMLKVKSLSPTRMSDDALNRLSGLLPENPMLSKAQTPRPEDHDKIMRSVSSFYYYQHVGEANKKTSLYLKKDNSLVWLPSGTKNSAEHELCLFCGDNKGRPFIADWDMVTIGLQKNAIKQWENKKSDLEVSFDKTLGNIPFWLKKPLEETNPSGVTQHGPESLYCKNPMQEDAFFAVDSEENFCNISTWDKLKEFLAEKEEEGYFIYEFKEFQTWTDDEKEEKAIDLKSNTTTLNTQIKSLK